MLFLGLKLEGLNNAYLIGLTWDLDVRAKVRDQPLNQMRINRSTTDRLAMTTHKPRTSKNLYDVAECLSTF